MSTHTNSSSSMILLVIIISTSVGFFSYFMARSRVQGYMGEPTQVATPAPAHIPGDWH